MRWPSLLALLGALLAVPCAQAGLRITTLEVTEEPLVPDLAVPAVAVVGEADCASVLARSQGADTVALQVEAAGPNLVVAGTGDHLVATAPCMGGTTMPFRFVLDAAVVRAAPAMEPQDGLVRVRFRPATGADLADPVQPSEMAFTLRARPLVVPQVVFEQRFATMRDAPATFNATVTNLGNVAFDVAGTGTVAGVVGRDVDVTAAVEVAGARVERGGSARITVTVGALDGRWDNAHALGEITVTSTLQPAGEPRTVPFDLLLTQHRETGGKDAPAAPVPLALLALALVALRLRR